MSSLALLLRPVGQGDGGAARRGADVRQRHLCRLCTPWYKASTSHGVVTPVFPRMEPCFAVALSSGASQETMELVERWSRNCGLVSLGCAPVRLCDYARIRARSQVGYESEHQKVEIAPVELRGNDNGPDDFRPSGCVLKIP